MSGVAPYPLGVKVAPPVTLVKTPVPKSAFAVLSTDCPGVGGPLV